MNLKSITVFFAAAILSGGSTYCALNPTELNNSASPFSDEYYAAQALVCVTDPSCANTSSAAVTSTLRTVAVGTAGRGYYSDDGTTWNAVNLTHDLNETYTAIVWDGTHFITVGSDTVAGTDVALYSADGINWTPSSFGTNCTAPATLLDVTAGNGIVVAVGDSSGGAAVCVQYSTDNGRTWTQGTGGGTFYPRVAHDGTNFIAMRDPVNNATVFTSADGMNFVAGGAPFTGGGNPTVVGDIARIGSSNSILYLGTDGVAGSGNMHSAISTDSGGSWTPAANNVFQGNASNELPHAAADNGSRLVVVGANCRMDYSDNLTNPFWNHGTAMTGCTAVDWNSVVYDGTRFVALGTHTGTMAGTIAVSSTGLPGDWTITTLPQSVTGMNHMALRP